MIDLGRDHRQEDQRLDRAGAAEPEPGEAQARAASPGSSTPTTAIAATWIVTHSASIRPWLAKQLRVPVEGEAQPDEVPARDVEAEHDQDHDRGEQDRVDPDRERGQPAARSAPVTPMTSRRRLRSARSVPARVTTISRNPSADPYGQSRPLVKMTWTILAIVVVWAPPSRSGRDEVTERRDEREQRRRDDARHRQRQDHVEERAGGPRRRGRGPAETRDGSSRSIETYSGRIANGRKPYVMPEDHRRSRC